MRSSDLLAALAGAVAAIVLVVGLRIGLPPSPVVSSLQSGMAELVPDVHIRHDALDLRQPAAVPGIPGVSGDEVIRLETWVSSSGEESDAVAVDLQDLAITVTAFDRSGTRSAVLRPRGMRGAEGEHIEATRRLGALTEGSDVRIVQELQGPEFRIDSLSVVVSGAGSSIEQGLTRVPEGLTG